ncbi:cytochrome c oxidase accessory protein CcoG [Betaproteobacteria bacterium GR16-43]|nr:cytochrome c oxidase accessory protein CcoG [Betaproteobacteria bacterium GR16-43]
MCLRNLASVIPIRPAPSGPEDAGLFEVRRKIYPRAVHGVFARWRWSLVWATQLFFYGMPWLSWNGRPALLFDLGARKFYVLGFVFWPQDFIYLTLLLVISALSLFLFTAVAGRLWCGYACPQTVYTEIFLWIERKTEGERSAREKLDREPMSVRKFVLKAAKHLSWGTLAFWTGFTFVGYFTPIRQLAMEFVTTALGPWEAFWILFYAAATYANAGFMREQVCKYMCPYARFQGAMFDRDTLVIAYDPLRGEPRGARSRQSDPKALGLGDCIDCTLCVQVCPTGIDIRKGLQYECIGCAACIDACDQVMDKVGYPKGLIRYATENAIARRAGLEGFLAHVARPRTFIYAAILGGVCVLAGTALFLRVPLKVDVIRDRGALVREVEDGELENVYRLQVMNATEEAHRYRLKVEGVPGLRVASDAEFVVEAAATRGFPVRLRAPRGALANGSHPIRISVDSFDTTAVNVTEKSVFIVR